MSFVTTSITGLATSTSIRTMVRGACTSDQFHFRKLDGNGFGIEQHDARLTLMRGFHGEGGGIDEIIHPYVDGFQLVRLFHRIAELKQFFDLFGLLGRCRIGQEKTRVEWRSIGEGTMGNDNGSVDQGRTRF